MTKTEINTLAYIAYNEDLETALKKIRDSQENDLGVYAEFCQETAKKALKGKISENCPNCQNILNISGSVPIVRGKYWTVGNHYSCSECGMRGELWIGHGKMAGKEKMVWEKG